VNEDLRKKDGRISGWNQRASGRIKTVRPLHTAEVINASLDALLDYRLPDVLGGRVLVIRVAF